MITVVSLNVHYKNVVYNYKMSHYREKDLLYSQIYQI